MCLLLGRECGSVTNGMFDDATQRPSWACVGERTGSRYTNSYSCIVQAPGIWFSFTILNKTCGFLNDCSVTLYCFMYRGQWKKQFKGKVHPKIHKNYHILFSVQQKVDGNLYCHKNTAFQVFWIHMINYLRNRPTNYVIINRFWSPLQLSLISSLN